MGLSHCGSAPRRRHAHLGFGGAARQKVGNMIPAAVAAEIERADAWSEPATGADSLKVFDSADGTP